MSSQESPSRCLPSPVDTSGSFYSSSLFSPDSITSSSSGLGQKRKHANASYFLNGTARAPFKSPSLGTSLSPLTPRATTAAQQERLAKCSVCAIVLATLVSAFQAAGMHGPLLHNRRLSHPEPKKARTTRQYRNVKGENEWILQNLFDCQGNYKFCHSCILAWIDVHEGRLARLRKVKQQQHQQPLQQMTKAEADTKKLRDYTVMPEDTHVSLSKWWTTLRPGDTVTIKYPHGLHQLAGKKSNRQDIQVIEVNEYKIKYSNK